MTTQPQWQPIETAPKDNARPLYLARFDEEGNLLEIDFNGAWMYERESWEMPHIEYWYWETEHGMEEPTHWAYQDEGPPPAYHVPTEDPEAEDLDLPVFTIPDKK